MNFTYTAGVCKKRWVRQGKSSSSSSNGDSSHYSQYTHEDIEQALKNGNLSEPRNKQILIMSNEEQESLAKMDSIISQLNATRELIRIYDFNI